MSVVTKYVEVAEIDLASAFREDHGSEGSRYRSAVVIPPGVVAVDVRLTVVEPLAFEEGAEATSIETLFVGSDGIVEGTVVAVPPDSEAGYSKRGDGIVFVTDGVVVIAALLIGAPAPVATAGRLRVDVLGMKL
jgi:hypothetical protein